MLNIILAVKVLFNRTYYVYALFSPFRQME